MVLTAQRSAAGVENELLKKAISDKVTVNYVKQQKYRQFQWVVTGGNLDQFEALVGPFLHRLIFLIVHRNTLEISPWCKNGRTIPT